MLMARYLVRALTALIGCRVRHAATRIDLNGELSFRTEAGIDWSATVPAGTRVVNLPGGWNRAGAAYEYLGTRWYVRRVDPPSLPAKHIALLNFGAIFYKARLCLNGVEIGAHEGGCTAYSFDVMQRSLDTRRFSGSEVVGGAMRSAGNGWRGTAPWAGREF